VLTYNVLTRNFRYRQQGSVNSVAAARMSFSIKLAGPIMTSLPRY
jgi:hypothetical protein